MQQQGLKLKKQGLQHLIQSYLCRQGIQDLHFMQKYLQSTCKAAMDINSNSQRGLTVIQVLTNADTYGRNVRNNSQSDKWTKICKLLLEQLLSMRSLVFLITVLGVLMLQCYWQGGRLYGYGLIQLTLILLLALLKIFLEYRALTILSGDNCFPKSQIPRVNAIRQGRYGRIKQQDIVVGDLLYVNVGEVVPVCGLVVEGDDVVVSEERRFGWGQQRKMTLEGCLKYAREYDQLKLKIQMEKGSLPSPIVLRGSKVTGGLGVKLLVLSVDEHQLLSHHLAKHPTGKPKLILEWIYSLQQSYKLLTRTLLIIIVFFNALAMIFKILGIPQGYAYETGVMLVQNILVLIGMSVGLQSRVLRNLLLGEYFQMVTIMGGETGIEQVLAYQILLISQQNICKYDRLCPKRIVLAGISEAVEVELLTALQPSNNYQIIREVLAGVQLDGCLLDNNVSNNQENMSNTNDNARNNVIIHVSDSQERVYSSLYNVRKQGGLRSDNLNVGDDSIGQLLRGQFRREQETGAMNRAMRQISSIDRVMGQMRIQHQDIINSSLSNSVGSASRSQNISRSQNMSRFQNISKSQSDKTLKLQEFLSRRCHFSTHNILQGLNQLADHQSRTYYFQKYTPQRLQSAKFIWREDRFIPLRGQEKQQLLQGINKIKHLGLKAFLLGVDRGAFHNHYMSYIVAAVGVEVNFNPVLPQSLNAFEDVGIKSLLLFRMKEGRLGQQQVGQYLQDMAKRGWAGSRDSFVSMDEIINEGGRLICSQCRTSQCLCVQRQIQLSNIQGFMDRLQGVRCIYDVCDDDVQYLTLGFQQLQMTTLRMDDELENTIQKIQQISAGCRLMNAMENNVSLWWSKVGLVCVCLFPFNYITFGHVLGHVQVLFIVLYVQMLMFAKYMVGSQKKQTEKSEQEKKRMQNGRRQKKILGVGAKTQLIVFVVGLLVSSICLYHFSGYLLPKGTLSPLIDKQECQIVKSYSHNPNLFMFKCHSEGQFKIFYSKIPTLILTFIIISMTLRVAISHLSLNLRSVLIQAILLGAYLVLLYLWPSLLSLYPYGLAAQQLGLCCGVGFLVAILSHGLGWCCGANSSQQELVVWVGKRGNDYSRVLKEFKKGRFVEYAPGK